MGAAESSEKENDLHQEVDGDESEEESDEEYEDSAATKSKRSRRPAFLPSSDSEGDFDDVDGDSDDGVTSWTNHAYTILSDMIGQGDFEKRLSEQFSDTPGKMMMADLQLKLHRQRLSVFHNLKSGGGDVTAGPQAVGAGGFIKMHDSPLSHTQFFRAGHVCRARIRHSNLLRRDDAALDGRVMCVKFDDVEQGGPLDLIMHTGSVSQFLSATQFEHYIEAVSSGFVEQLRDWCLKYPANYYGRVESVRREPGSYYDQHYYSHITYQMEAGPALDRYSHKRSVFSTPLRQYSQNSVVTDGDDLVFETQHCNGYANGQDRRVSSSSGTSNSEQTSSVGGEGTDMWVRFRVVPAKRCQETGRATEIDQKQVWDSVRLSGVRSQELPKNYLRTEYLTRIGQNALQYRLQSQTRPAVETERNEALNPCLRWTQPWTDVAILTLTQPLPEQVAAKTQFCLCSLPPCLRLPAACSLVDPASLAHVMADYHGDLSATYTTSDVDDAFVTQYEVTVVTGNVGGSGTDADVIITMSGSQGRAHPISLDNLWVDDFEAGQEDHFTVSCPPIGVVTTVQMELRSMMSREWFLDEVRITHAQYPGEVWRFPCFGWLSTGGDGAVVLLRRADGMLAHEEFSLYTYMMRDWELGQKQQLYRWDKQSHLPGKMQADSYHALPKECKFHVEKQEDLRAKYLRTLTNTGVGTIKSMFKGWNLMTDYESLLTSLLKDKKAVKKVACAWEEDVEFGRQCLQGVHPTRIRRIHALPPDFDVTQDIVESFLNRDSDLAQELKDGNLYLLAYPELAPLVTLMAEENNHKRHIVAPYCLLYVRKDGALVPIAIQLAPDGVVWTPEDAKLDWLLAKMWVRVADANVHQVVSRHLKTHLVMEVISVATYRHLPPVHPVYKLLLPHLRYTIAVNVMGRSSLYPAEDGLFEKFLATGKLYKQLLKTAYRTFSLQELNIPRDIEARGVGAHCSLHNYCYRDDALLLWRVIAKFVRTMLMLHYWTADNVREDVEIQAWVRALGEEGFPAEEGHRDHGVPDGFHSLDHLIEFVTIIIFTASGQNAALTRGMMDYYGFIPNMPTLLYKAPPTERGQVDHDWLMEVLPSRQKTAEVIAATYTLSQPSRDEVYLGNCPSAFIVEETKLLAMEAFREDLAALSASIAERNSQLDTLDIPYTYLSPDRVPNSISN